jgi:hypothetical protein
MELETALARGIPVVPVLVGGARMPAPASLPETLQDFATRQAFPLSDLRWHAELQELAGQLATLSPTLGRALHVRGGAQKDASGSSAPGRLARRALEDATRGYQSRHRPRWPLLVVRWLGVRTKKLVTTAVVLAVLYIVMREFGGPDLNRYFDRFVARVVDTGRALFDAPMR